MDNLPHLSPQDLAEATGDFAAIGQQTIYGRACRKRDAIEAVRERYRRLYTRLVWRLEDEIKRVEKLHG